MPRVRAEYLRTYVIDGEERTDTTYRTPLIEHYAEIPGRSFLDLGAADGYEGRAVAHRGASRVVAVEGRDESVRQAVEAQEAMQLTNLRTLQADVRTVDELDLGTFDVTLCFGLLYHMADPADLLRRIRKITSGQLLVETHVAPPKRFRWRRGLLPKHVEYLSHARRMTRELDGIELRGLDVPQPEHRSSKGSLDAPVSFWLERPSLRAAIEHAGFRIDEWIEDAEALPESVRRFGHLLGVGRANTKVWAVASPATSRGGHRP